MTTQYILLNAGTFWVVVVGILCFFLVILAFLLLPQTTAPRLFIDARTYVNAVQNKQTIEQANMQANVPTTSELGRQLVAQLLQTEVHAQLSSASPKPSALRTYCQARVLEPPVKLLSSATASSSSTKSIKSSNDYRLVRYLLNAQ